MLSSRHVCLSVCVYVSLYARDDNFYKLYQPPYVTGFIPNLQFLPSLSEYGKELVW